MLNLVMRKPLLCAVLLDLWLCTLVHWREGLVVENNVTITTAVQSLIILVHLIFLYPDSGQSAPLKIGLTPPVCFFSASQFSITIIVLRFFTPIWARACPWRLALCHCFVSSQSVLCNYFYTLYYSCTPTMAKMCPSRLVSHHLFTSSLSVSSL